MKRRAVPGARRFTSLDVLRDLMLGGRHSRNTVARFGVSLPTADRWLADLARNVPGVRKVREGKVSWFEWRTSAKDPGATRPRRPPSAPLPLPPPVRRG